MTQTQNLSRTNPVFGIVYLHTRHEMTYNIDVIRPNQDRTNESVEDVILQMLIPYTTIFVYEAKEFMEEAAATVEL